MTAVAAVGLTAAFLFALSAFLQARAARAAVGGDPSSLRESSGVNQLVRRLARSRTWLIGWLTNLCGFGAQAAALKLGSVATVQPLMSTQLLFVLSMTSAEQRRWPKARDWVSALAVCGGLVLLLTAEGGSPLIGSPRRDRVLLATVCAVGLIVILVLVSRLSPARIASMLVGVGAGLCHAMNAVFLKMTIDDLLGRGVAATAVDWPGYALAVSTLSGLLLGQLAFASGALPPAVASISVTNPVASLAVGLLAFDVPVPTGAGALAALAISGVVLAAGITGLANSPSMQRMYRVVAAGDGLSASPGHGS